MKKLSVARRPVKIFLNATQNTERLARSTPSGVFSLEDGGQEIRRCARNGTEEKRYRQSNGTRIEQIV